METGHLRKGVTTCINFDKEALAIGERPEPDWGQRVEFKRPMSKTFMASSLFVAIACLGAAGFATIEFLAKSDDCFENATACLGQSVVRSRSAVGEVVNNWE